MIQTARQIVRRARFLFKKRYSVDELVKKNSNGGPLKLHLGCGGIHLDGWINIDVTEKSMADIVMDFKEIKNNFRSGTVNEILMVHSISYLRLWEARDFFGEVFNLLEPGGQLTMEFPDIAKCAVVIADKNSSRENYIEAVRAFYAFDMDEIRNRHPYYPYHFGWSADHISEELKSAGFKTVKVLDPQTHSERTWRDSRVEAIK